MKASHDSPYILIDFADDHDQVQRKVFTNPLDVLCARRVDEVRPVLKQVQKAVDQGYYAVGYVSYEAASAFDPAFSVHANPVLPLAWFGIFSDYDTEWNIPEGDYMIGDWVPTISEEEYRQGIRTILDAIARGDTYQVNYTMRLRSRFSGDPQAFYKRLCAAQQARYTAMIHLGEFSILSASPELFFAKRDGLIITRPMKGTVRRGRWLEEDEKRACWLQQSVKNRAENVMITDLLRNDLGLIAETGTVKVPKLFEIEKYYTLFQMTSTVTAVPKTGTTFEKLFEALFPCGSITGAPKVSTMNLIHQLEPSPREVYCGSIGMIAPDGSATFNVAIRTVWIDHRNGQAEYGVGGGITWESDAADEYEEAKTKALLLTEMRPEFQLLESILLENGTYFLLEEHMKRMESSAKYFDFSFDRSEMVERLEKHAAQHPHGMRKVRVLLARTGEITVESDAIRNPDTPIHVVLAENPVPSSDRFLYHKTTHREIYNSFFRRKGDAFDVLLWNEKGEITEFTMGNIVVEIEGQLYTPPRECGLLAGTFRNDLLKKGAVMERIIRVEDLDKAEQVWFINSVRKWLPVRIKHQLSLSEPTVV